MNRLALEKSPYLLQHAANPVHWQPWGEAALAEARQAQKPILLSIGYAACHWCHVMAHESFENPETAALMNRLYVNIKVDREERPDIDHIYMAALHALGEQGGWPLTMFLAPDAAPFWGGTYFPPEPRWGRPSFRQILAAVAEAFHRGDPAVATNGRTLARALAAGAATAPGPSLTPGDLARVSGAYLRLVDHHHGGLSGAPKFPNAPIFRFLWQVAGTPGRAAVHDMLRHMSRGGIYDHLGGGYARYSTDAEWLVPHFEKMLYDNAQLLELLSFAHADRPDPLYAARARETVDWLRRDMAAGDAFAASEDADSEGEEGRFYVWTPSELRARLGADYPVFAAAYDVTETGNWEGRIILRQRDTATAPADEPTLADCRAVLFRARAERPRPGRDDKVLADWNGLVIAALARAAAVFGEPAWLAAAQAAEARILHLLGRPDGRIDHAWRDNQTTAAGLLEDQAAMARAALALHEATGDPACLARAAHIAGAARRFFADADGSFFATASDAPDVPLLRPRSVQDAATPSGNGMMAEVLVRLAHLTGDPEWHHQADSLLTAFTGRPETLAGMPTLLAAAHLLETAATIVVTGSSGTPAVESLVQAAQRAPMPTILLRAPPGVALPASHPAHGKPTNQPAAYLCRNNVCMPAITDPATLITALAQ